MAPDRGRAISSICSVWIVALLSACSASEAGVASSLGQAADGAPEWTLSREPLLRIGHLESDPIHNVKAAAWLDQELVYSDGTALVFRDRHGELIRQIGRRGEGPGEFRNLSGFSESPGGFIAWDGFLRRISRLDRSGRYLGSATLIHDGGATTLVGAVGENALFRVTVSGFAGEGGAPPQEVRHDEEFLLVRPLDGTILGTWSVPATARWSMRENTAAGRNGGIPVLFGRDPVVAVTGDVAYIGTTGAIDFTRIDVSGSVSRIHLRHDTIPTDPRWERYLRDSIRAEIDAITPGRLVSVDGVNRQMGWKKFRSELLEGLPARTTVPPFSDLKGDRQGRLWLREYPIPGRVGPATWIVVEPPSTVLGRVELPADVEVLDISHGHVVILREGALGQEILEVYQPLSGQRGSTAPAAPEPSE